MLRNPSVSIIIVKYKSEGYLANCLSSIGQNDLYEIIVVYNDRKNIGFGAGCNRGARKGKGKYLFFLNPDTLILPGAIEELASFLDKNKDAGIVSPLLLDKSEKPSFPQGTGKLTPLSAIVSFSFLNKYFPNNPISKDYWFSDWDKKTIQEADVAPGAALMIRREVFEKLGGFDKKFFLYFEETDLCQRVKEKGWKIYLNPEAKIIHYGGGSTVKDNIQIFKKSRFYYFKKHWGILPALFVESFLRSGEWLAGKI